jgi:hypothetical protein
MIFTQHYLLLMSFKNSKNDHVIPEVMDLFKHLGHNPTKNAFTPSFIIQY